MPTPDAFNAGLELLWALGVAASIRKLLLDRALKGLSAWHVGLMVVSSWWFIFYYGHLEQWWSFGAALAYAASVAVWVACISWFGIRAIMECDDGQA